jgi:predicted Zn-dependent protease with MMP-like domain
LVARALDELPAAFRKRIENVAVIVQQWPTKEDLEDGGVPKGQTLLGLYQGVSLPHRGATSYHGALPDRLVIFSGPILASAGSPADVTRMVRETVIHEVGHYFGLSEREIQRAERARTRR